MLLDVDRYAQSVCYCCHASTHSIQWHSSISYGKKIGGRKFFSFAQCPRSYRKQPVCSKSYRRHLSRWWSEWRNTRQWRRIRSIKWTRPEKLRLEQLESRPKKQCQSRGPCSFVFLPQLGEWSNSAINIEQRRWRKRFHIHG